MNSTEELITQRFREERLSRLTRYIAIGGAIWACFSFANWLEGATWSSVICGFGALLSALVYPLANHAVGRRMATAYAYLVINLAGVVCMSLVTGQADSCASLFLCSFGLFAAHCIGIRASLIWTLIGSFCIIAINSEIGGKFPALDQHTTLDKTLHCVALMVLLFLLNWQAQHYFIAQSRELASKTDSLSDKAAALQKLAQFDTLTGLFNRHSFRRQAHISLMESRERNKRMAILLLDLDGFKEVNDTQGHQAGDSVLRIVAQRLRQQVDGDHLVSRLGGDEFTVIVEQFGDEAEVMRVGEKIGHALTQPYVVDGKSFPLGVSIGFANYPLHSRSVDGLLAFADTAMYHAKRTCQTVVMYDREMTDSLVRRRNLEHRLSHALEGNEFRLLYQPQLNVSSEKIVGFEALLRWNRDGKWISPNEFIGPLESTREICNVGRWGLHVACKQAQEWRAKGFDIQMSVNVSPVQFRDPRILDNVMEALEVSGLPPSSLDLELTESLLIDDVNSTAQILECLRNIGVQVSIDDFGTGCSSLAYLRDLPLTRLKIDRAFIKGIPDEDDGLIAKAVVGLSHSLNLKVLAEGVEEKSQLDFLKQHGCDEYQGYYFARPSSIEDCEQLLLRDIDRAASAELDTDCAKVL